MTTLTLHDIGEQLRALEQLLEETGGEWTPEIDQWLAEYGGLERAKVDALAGFLRSQEAFAKACEDEAAALIGKAQAAKNTVRRLKQYVLLELQQRGLKELAGDIWKVARQANGGKAPMSMLIVDPAEAPAQYVKMVPTIDTELVRRHLEAGDATEVAAAAVVAKLEPRGEHVRVK